jgi:putative membrane protein
MRWTRSRAAHIGGDLFGRSHPSPKADAHVIVAGKIANINIIRNFPHSSGIVRTCIAHGTCTEERDMNTIEIVGAALLMSSAAFGQSLGEKTGVNSAFGIAPTTQDFITEAAMGGMFEVESSKLAVRKSEGPVKDFAAQMIVDHTKAGAELSADAKSENLAVPTALDSANQDKLDKLQKLNGPDFSNQYMDYQVSAHKDAVSLFQRYGRAGDNAKLKAFAVTTLPALQHHLDMAQGLDK